MSSMLGQVLTAMVTPFGPDGTVNVEAFKRLCTHLLDNGSDGLVVAGTTGEGPTVTDDERLELFGAAVEIAHERGATVVANTGTYATAHSVHLTREADQLGVDGFLVVTPYYNKPPPAGIVAHFETLASVTDRPIVVYNIPQRVVVNIEPETLAELGRIPNVL
jgi:4-hydroxy-tetrahydrodipicolinate synthase